MTYWLNDNYTNTGTASSTQYQLWTEWRRENGKENPPEAGVREPRRQAPSGGAGHLALEHAPT